MSSSNHRISIIFISLLNIHSFVQAFQIPAFVQRTGTTSSNHHHVNELTPSKERRLSLLSEQPLSSLSSSTTLYAEPQKRIARRDLKKVSFDSLTLISIINNTVLFTFRGGYRILSMP